MIQTNRSSDEVLISLRRILRAIDLHSRKLIQHYGFTVPQIIVLKEIEQSDSPVIGEIAHAVNLSQATVTNILSRLSARGLIERTPHKTDKRRVVVTLTGKGKMAVENAPALLHDKFTSSFERLKDWEKHLIISSLQRVAEMMDAGKLEASPVLSSSYALSTDSDDLNNHKTEKIN